MNKETFCQILKTIEDANKFQDQIHDICCRYSTESRSDVTMFGLGLGLEDVVISLLEEIMGDTDGDIRYFCWELLFGEDWEPGMVTDKNGADVDFSTAEKLYDYLTRDDN